MLYLLVYNMHSCHRQPYSGSGVIDQNLTSFPSRCLLTLLSTGLVSVFVAATKPNGYTTKEEAMVATYQENPSMKKEAEESGGQIAICLAVEFFGGSGAGFICGATNDARALAQGGNIATTIATNIAGWACGVVCGPPCAALCSFTVSFLMSSALMSWLYDNRGQIGGPVGDALNKIDDMKYGGDGCFPSDAVVHVAGRGAVQMIDLAYGDRVLARDHSSGQLVFREVFVFGHRLPNTVAPYINIKTAAGTLLQLTPHHYIPVCMDNCNSSSKVHIEAKYAADVSPGDVVLVTSADYSRVLPSRVTAAWESHSIGLYHPAVRGADIIVNRVVATTYAKWMLDSVTPSSLRKYLPAVYEVMYAPIYLVYKVLGPENTDWLAHEVGLIDAEHHYGHGSAYLPFVGVVSIAVLVPSWAVALLVARAVTARI
jgi:hypothetical protein